MNYVDFLKRKLRVEKDTDLIDAAVIYLGDEYPLIKVHEDGYKTVDQWFEKIKAKWNIEIKNLNLKQSKFLGKLEPKDKGFIINLNKNLFLTKKRFTIAHEIAHILSYDTSINWPVNEIRHSKIEEYYCDRIARTMILPKSLINLRQIDLKNLNPQQLNYLKKLSREYKVSFWQILTKLYEDLGNKSLVCIYWKYYQDESCLRIENSLRPYEIFIPLRKHSDLNYSMKKIQTNTSPAIAFNSSQLYQGYDLIEIGSLYKKKLFSTAFPFKTKADNYVFQIIDLENEMHN